MTSGKGLKKTYAWFTDLTEVEISTKIEEFWETRINGDKEIWNNLRKICLETDENLCKEIIKKSRISLPNKNLMLVYDSRGFRYDLPIFVINPPLKYGSQEKAKSLENIEDKEFQVLIRIAGNPDCPLRVSTLLKVSEAKKKLQEALNLSKEFRLFFNGKELQNDSFLGNYKLSEGNVIIVF